MTRKKYLAGLLFIITSLNLSGNTNLAGRIDGIIFDTTGNPYIVEKDIVIPEGKSVTVKQGCIFLFKPFSGLAVHGSLNVEGTPDKPVVFTSINDSQYNAASEQLPNPFDWDGIIISQKSDMVTLKNFHLKYSVYGIKSQKETISLQSGNFAHNGQFHFTLDGNIQYVQDNIPFSYNAKAGGKGKTGSGADLTGKKVSREGLKKIAAWSSVVAGLGAGAGGAYFIMDAAELEAEKSQTGRTKSEEAEFDKKIASSRNIAIALFSGTGLCTALSTILFISNSKDIKKPKVAVGVLWEPDNRYSIQTHIRF
ncbi:MAG: hypothetical protein GF401_15720 [Chitinivibrionales bacterium]|nr:hypothetical protein [Chitinivibrionales bacterium]